MTTITSQQPAGDENTFSAGSVILPRLAEVVAICFACLVAAALALIVVTDSGLRENVYSHIEQRLALIGEPTFRCDVAGNSLQSGDNNCFDHRGFRVIRSGGYRVFSLRYSKPLFVFGVERGMVVENQRIPVALQRSEADSFMRYLSEVQ